MSFLAEVPEYLTLTEAALQRIEAYARLAARRFRDVECMGYLGSSPDSDVIDTVILAEGQRVSGASVRISAQSTLAAGRTLQRLGKRPRGWWHSHGALDPFHSHTDDANTADLLNQLSSVNAVLEDAGTYAQPTTERGRVVFRNDRNEQLELAVDADLAAELLQRGVTLRRRIPVGLAFSLVVNARGGTPHAELHLRRTCSVTNKASVSRQVVPVQVVPTLDEAELLAEIEANVRPVGVLSTIPADPVHAYPPAPRPGRNGATPRPADGRSSVSLVKRVTELLRG